MSGSQEQSGSAPVLSTARMEAFSDGVFAIAATLLVLEIPVPSGSGRDLIRAIFEQWPSYIGYLVSFLTIGTVWLRHDVITEGLERATPRVLRANLLLLLAVGFLPYPTHVMAEFLKVPESEQVAVIFYGLALLATQGFLWLLWWSAKHDEVFTPALDQAERQQAYREILPSLGFYGLAVCVSIILPPLGVGLYVAIAILGVIPARTFRRRMR